MRPSRQLAYFRFLVGANVALFLMSAAIAACLLTKSAPWPLALSIFVLPATALLFSDNIAAWTWWRYSRRLSVRNPEERARRTRELLPQAAGADTKARVKALRRLRHSAALVPTETQPAVVDALLPLFEDDDRKVAGEAYAAASALYDCLPDDLGRVWLDKWLALTESSPARHPEALSQLVSFRSSLPPAVHAAVVGRIVRGVAAGSGVDDYQLLLSLVTLRESLTEEDRIAVSDALIADLSSERPARRPMARLWVTALQLMPESRRARFVDCYIALLESGVAVFRGDAAYALASLGRGAPPALAKRVEEALERAARGDNEPLRRDATGALKSLRRK